MVRANASLSSLEKKIEVTELKEYINKTFKENDTAVKTDKKKKSKEGDDKGGKLSRNKNEEYVSKTDSDAKMAKKENVLTDMYYLTHYGTDSKKKVITGVLTTCADIGDSTSLVKVVDKVATNFKKK